MREKMNVNKKKEIQHPDKKLNDKRHFDSKNKFA